jgi:hypothetical protein
MPTGEKIGDALGIIGVIGTILAEFHAHHWKHQFRLLQQGQVGLRVVQDEGIKTSRIRHIAVMTAAEEHKKDLKEQALSQPIAKFPDNVDALARFIVDADVELCILTDSIGYALYSNPDGHKRYLEAIEAVVKKGCKVRFVLYSLDTLRASIARQFPQGEDNKQWKKERESQRCKNFSRLLARRFQRAIRSFVTSFSHRNRI